MNNPLNKKILVTGGAGFIGSALIRHIIQTTPFTVVNVDKLTYASNLESLSNIDDDPRYYFEKTDICDKDKLTKIFIHHQPDLVMHLAAESHVDRSIESAGEFISTNIVGTYTLLEVVRIYWGQLDKEKQQNFRFHSISTDEVYGDLINDDEAANENTRYNPSSPYSASKAASDHLVNAWHRTYGVPIIISNCSNNYGPYQYQEKLIPLMITNALAGKILPVYGDGKQIRDWLYVEDHVTALLQVVTQGKIGESYNIGGDCQLNNIQVINAICDCLQELIPNKTNPSTPYRDLITFVNDRPGHDLRYAIDASKIKKELGWIAKENFKSGLLKTVQWYLDNPGDTDKNLVR